MLTDRVHALIDDKLYRGCTSFAEWTPRLNPIPHTDAPAKATHDATHQRTAGIRPQSRLFLCGVTPLSGVLHRLGDGVMLPNWCNAP